MASLPTSQTGLLHDSVLFLGILLDSTPMQDIMIPEGITMEPEQDSLITDPRLPE